jgi:hypothetical protein
VATKSRSTRKPAEPKTGQLNTAGQVQVVARTLQGLRTQRFQAEVVQTANDHNDDDLHPDQGVPYSEVFKQLDEAESRLTRKYRRLMPQINRVLGADDKKDDNE